MQRSEHTVQQLEDMSEAELESLAMAKQPSALAKYVLGKLHLEGCSDKVPLNDKKGLNWLKEAVAADCLPALEYKTYYDIKFDRAPKMEKIIANLERIVTASNSCLANNVLGELNHSLASAALGQKTTDAKVAQQAAENAVNAAKYYLASAEQGNVIGMHFMGVFYSHAFGVAKNTEKAVAYLTKAAAEGHCHSMYHLYNVLSGNEGADKSVANPEVAYKWLMQALQYGITHYDDANKYFREHFDVLAPKFVASRKLALEVNEKTKADILNMHDAFVNELRADFSAGLSNDRLYHKPAGFINDQQSWMIGVQMHYFIDKVLHFSHKDFLLTMRTDLGPILGTTGLWALKRLAARAKEEGNAELKKKAAVVTEIVEKYLDSGLEVLGDERKFNFINKFGPKKLPDRVITRESVPHIYSWSHYATPEWHMHTRKDAQQTKQKREGKVGDEIYCNACQSPQGLALKHKICSGCKVVYYCSVECQRVDWKSGHREVCKASQAAKKGKK